MRELIEQILSTGRVSYGPISLEFEKRFAALHECSYGILSNSGTSSLHVALQALKEVHHWERGQVIVPATTFVATANIVVHNGLVPVFVDVDPRTYNLDPTLLEAKITEDTRAIIPVHLFGQPADMTAIMGIAKRHNLRVIEDSCETMFVHHGDKMVGSMGDIGCFSMYVAHLIVAGVGGIATTNNPEYAAKMRSLVNHGLKIEFLNPGDNFSPQPMMGRRFQFDTRGHSFRITEFEAALALAQIEERELHFLLNSRRANARHLKQRLENLNKHYGVHFQTPYTAEDNEHAYMMFPIVLTEMGDGRKDELVAHLNRHNIETRDMLPLLNQPAYHWLTEHDYPVSANLVKNGFYVGCHQHLSSDEIGYIADTIWQWVEGNKDA